MPRRADIENLIENFKQLLPDDLFGRNQIIIELYLSGLISLRMIAQAIAGAGLRPITRVAVRKILLKAGVADTDQREVWVSFNQASQMTGLGPGTLARFLHSGKVPVFLRLERSRPRPVFKKEDLQPIIQQCQKPRPCRDCQRSFIPFGRQRDNCSPACSQRHHLRSRSYKQAPALLGRKIRPWQAQLLGARQALPPDSTLISALKAAELTGLNRNTIYRLMVQGGLSAIAIPSTRTNAGHPIHKVPLNQVQLLARFHPKCQPLPSQ